MRLATWNVNSLRSRIGRVEAFLERHDVDVLALQETKARDDQLPLMGLQSMGYEVASAGTSQWNGVAVVSRVGLDDVEVGFPEHARLGRPGWPPSPARSGRPAAASASGRSTCPTAASSTTPTTPTSSSWLARLRDAARAWSGTPTALVGDWNIAPQDDDVFAGFDLEANTHVSPRERAAFEAVLDAGYADVVRPHAPGPDVYTYWDYYRQRFERNRGMRIDFVLGSPSLAAAVTGAFVDRDERAGTGRLRPRTGGRRRRPRAR